MIWKSRKQNRQRGGVDAVKRRSLSPERLEARRLLSADAIQVGVVYLETDYLESDQDVGSDSRGDRFILSFTGGAPGTELSELRIRTDKDGDGLSVGDPMFDTAIGGRGKGGAHGFQVVRVRTSDGRSVDATAQVQDGGQELLLQLSNFRAGDRLEFTIDVDEILRNSTDLAIFNDRLDVITSGQEFQDSMLEATFEAPHYEKTHADAIFANDFGDPTASHGLDLPPDEGTDIDSRPNRSAAALARATQTPKPVEISGHVWLDNDLDLRRESGELGLAGVELSLWKQSPSGSYQDTGHRATTDSAGRYRFAQSLGLMPGTYRVVQQQPDNLLSVGAVVGTTDGSPNGAVESADAIRDIRLPLGDTVSIDQDFAEAAPASLSGFVYRDLDNDGRREAGEAGIAGVRVRLVATDTIAPQSSLTTTTAADGSYRFDDLAPGSYEVIEVSQPTDLVDGIDSAGTVAGRIVGVAENPGDRIHSITLSGSDVGTEYNFAELPFGSLSGFVFLAAPGSDCDGDHDSPGNQVLPGVQITLQNEFGETVAQTVTDSNGWYRFERVAVGTYAIAETTPSGLINGDSHVGTIGGVSVGASVDGGLIRDIIMTPGGVGEAYNFCEGTPATISGHVYHDVSNDGRRDPGEAPIAKARISLVDAQGRVVATRETDAEGRYEFSGLQPGRYTIQEQQPTGYLDGIDSPGTIRGKTTGRSDGLDAFTSIELQQGDVGVDYDFGELLPSSISGVVYVDQNGDCLRDPQEPMLAGVTIELRDAAGDLIATAQTDLQGAYRFDQLEPGSYQVFERQPEGYFQGGQDAGNGAGQVLGADLLGVSLGSGQQVVDFNFCEIAPSSIGGSVWKESQPNQRLEPGDTPLPGVIIELIDTQGNTVKQTRTGQAGEYRFDFLAPGVYAVRQTQPAGLFSGGQIVGSAGGRVGGENLVVGIELLSGTAAQGYDFPEVPPATISGFVFQDGETLTLEEVPEPSKLRDYQDGVLGDDDSRLPGVTLELRDRLGQPLDASAALPGTYSPGPIRITTDAEGFYEFVGLRPGTYHVYQKQPDNFIDGLDTPGSTGGLAINQADAQSEDARLLIEDLASRADTDPGSDAILNITVVGDGRSTDNNFSELVVIPPPTLYLPPAEPIRVPGMTETPTNIESFDPPIRLVAFAAPGGILPPLDPYRMLWDALDEWAVSWHLSVINGGYPRGVIVDSGNVHSVSVALVQPTWSRDAHSKGQWTLGLDGRSRQSLPAITLGEIDATALAGDFNGDGSDEAVIFVAGQWYVDLNGDGRWDEGDLWIQLGTELDRPIVGDWDGDGKDDIAIFGRQWQRDFLRIIRDPGLPDPANMRRRKIDPRAAKAVREESGEDPQRLLRRGTEGSLRADAVDHVFQYGEQVDTPIAGDWNGDGIDQVGVFRDGHWLLDIDGDGRRNDEDRRVQFGQPGDIPIVGDFNGDKIDEIGVVRGDLWIIDIDGDRRLTGNDLQIKVPRAGENSQPVVGDFDGDGKDEPGYYDEAA